jgi:hypothetical protein
MSLLREQIVPVSQSKTKLPGSPSESTVRRWAKRGVVGKKSKEVHRLEICYIGSTMYTSIEAIERWSDRLTEEFL